MTVTKLRRIRRERGFTSCHTLAAAMGLSYMGIYYWEVGHSRPRNTPVHPTGERLETMLGTPLETLLEPEDERKTAPTEKADAVTRTATSSTNGECVESF
jgi:hypothetical protein